MRAWLLDTGPLVAYLDASEKEHAVVTEAMHFVAAVRKRPILLAEFVAQSGIEVFDYGQADELTEAARRMEKYADLPMDYADATLVLLAERLGIFDILTFDRRGFSVYRSSRGKRFSLLLDQPDPKR